MQKDIEKKHILTTHEGFEFEVTPSYKNISFAVQNIIATIMKMCLKELANKKEHIINVVHDSVWVSCPEAVIKDIKNIMEQVVRGLLPEELDRYDIELIKLTKLGGK